jgi:hypothetical protein
VVLCRHAPEVSYEALQAEVQASLGISRERLGRVLTWLAGARKLLPRDDDYPIERDKDLRRSRIEPVAAELLLVRWSALAWLAWCRARFGRCLACRPDRRGTSGCLQDQLGVDLNTGCGSWPAGQVPTKASGPGGGRPHTHTSTSQDNRS